MRIHAAVLALFLLAGPALAKGREVRVSAGAHDRRDTVVSFALPDAVKGTSYVLRDATGKDLALQVDETGRAWFVLPALTAGAVATYTLEAVSAPPASSVVATRDGDAVSLTRGGRQILRYLGGPGVLPEGDIKPVYRRGGYIHPVTTPSGRVVTGDYAKGHRHHHGIWFAWTKTEFEGRTPDFWNMAEQKGTVEFEALEATWSGPVLAGLRARHRYVDLTAGAPKAVLRETWETRAFAVGSGDKPYHLFDVDVRQAAVTAAPLVLPQYHYGGIGYRGPDAWLGAANAFFLTSEGKDRAGNESRARWVHLSGDVDGQRTGTALLAHPQNYRAPEPVRLHPTEPFFCFAPSQLGAWSIKPSAPHVARYRVVAFDGAPDPRELDRLWQDYAEPPEVTFVTAPRARPAKKPVKFDVRAFDRARVLTAAKEYLSEAPITVTAASSPRSAGGPHDFFSEGDYWWPDPANPKGPYIQRDGQTNPDNFVEHRKAMMRLSVQLPALAAAWQITGDAKYAEHAARHLRAWFLDEKTRMNPHLRYAQAIQGITTGRGIGIIDTLHLVEVARAIEVMEKAPGLSPEERKGVVKWFADYLHWMTTDKNGLDEREAKNNHGTTWALQVAAFARLTGNQEQLDYVRHRFKTVLVPNQIAPDGSFPLELRRTKPYAYALFNLEAFAGIAQLLSTPQDDLWDFETADGRGLRRAVAYLVPYIRDKKSWPLKPDVMYHDDWPMRQSSLLFSGLAFGEPSYVALWKTLPADSKVDEVIRNFFIRQPVLWVKRS